MDEVHPRLDAKVASGAQGPIAAFALAFIGLHFLVRFSIHTGAGPGGLPLSKAAPVTGPQEPSA